METSGMENPQTLGSKEIRCLNTLKGTVDYELQKNRNDPCVEGSGQWFFNHPLFEEFFSEKGSQLLLVTAEAGGGKSTVMRTLADKLQASTDPPLVAFFFFKDDTDRLCSYEEAICGLLYQIMTKNKGFIKQVKPFCDRFGDDLKHNTEVLWKAIAEIAAHTHQDIVCILDAVDECEAFGRKQLVTDLKTFFHDSSRASARLKLVVSSRPCQDDSHAYGELMLPAGANIRHLAGENGRVQPDIEKVIRSKAESLAQKRGLDPAIRELLVEKLTAQNQQTKSFLAVRMAFELLDHDLEFIPRAGEETIKNILARIPRHLGDQFDEMLNRSRDPQHANGIFCVVLSARKTLKIDELKVVYVLTKPLEPGSDLPASYDDLEEMHIENEGFKKRVRATCGLFITFVGNSVHLFHQTAREHLLKRTQQASRRPGCSSPEPHGSQMAAVETRTTWRHSILLANANFVCAEICLRILNFNVPTRFPLEVFDRLEEYHSFQADITQFVKGRPLWVYAALNWCEHIQLADRSIQEIFQLGSYDAMLDLSMPQFWSWFLVVADHQCNNITSSRSYKAKKWPISSIWTHGNYVKDFARLLRKGCIDRMLTVDEKLQALFKGEMDLKTSDSDKNEAAWRVSKGFQLIDRFHFAQGQYEYTSSTQAIHAIETGDKDRAALLRTDFTPIDLTWSSILAGAPHTFEQALASVKDMTWLDDIPSHTLFQSAQEIGWSNMDKKGLREVCQKKWEKPYPPSFVVIVRSTLSRSCEEIWKGLADWIDRNPEKSEYARKAWKAGGFMVPSLARRLVDSGVLVDLEMWGDCRTALQIAATSWEHSAVQELLKLGADPIKSTSNGYNALDWFLFHERFQVGNVIFPHPKGLSFRHHYLKSSIASSLEAMMKAAGARKHELLNHQCSRGETPLMRAVQSSRSSPTAVGALLKEGALVNTRDKNNETALMKFFCETGFRKFSLPVLRQLLHFGADPLATDQDGRSVLEYWWGCLLTTQLAYLNPGFNIFNQSFEALANIGPLSDPDLLVQQIGGINIPLIVAVQLGNAQLCSALLVAGTDPNTATFDKNSRLFSISSSGALEMEELGWNPLLVALKKKAYTTAVLLMEHGANVKVKAPGRERGRRTKYTINKGGTTPLHLALCGDNRLGYVSELSLREGDGHQGCSFQNITKRDQAKPPAFQQYDGSKRHGYSEEEIDFESDYEILKKGVFEMGASLLPYDTVAKVKHGFDNREDPLIKAIIDQELDSGDRTVALVEYLLSKGASINACTVGNLTPLYVATRAGMIPVIEMLLRHGADPNIATFSGSTPLMLAALLGHERIVEQLLAANADVEAQQYEREPGKCECRNFISWGYQTFHRCEAPLTALAIAADRGHVRIVQLLLQAGADPNRTIIHHTHGRLPSRKEKRKAHRPSLFPFQDTDDSDEMDDNEPEQGLWKGFIHVGTALTWAEGECRDQLLQAGATQQDSSRECGCAIEMKRMNGLFYDSYDENESSESNKGSSHKPSQDFGGE